MHNAFSIALIEDHHELRELLVDCLSAAGYHITGVSCADELNEVLASQKLNLLIVDLNLPGEDGISIAQRIRKASPDIYIIMLTARSAEHDRIMGYTAGADIYLVKPISQPELLAAVDGIARRVTWKSAKTSKIRLNADTLLLSGDNAIVLTAAETKVLKALIEAALNQLEYFELMELASIEFTLRGKANLEVMMVRLRKKLYEVGAEKPAIKAVHNIGYKLITPIALDN
jgi:DNA-binding response OmpR family regulator